MVKILVFDTETTGLPPRIKQENKISGKDKSTLNTRLLDTCLEQWPSIIQLSYIIYDTEDPKNSKIFNKYIDLPDTIEISKESMAIHHITKERISAMNGANRAIINDALDEFMTDVDIADVVVGHNVKFDIQMIIAELKRLSKQHFIVKIENMKNGSKFDCTMTRTQRVCNLMYSSSCIDNKTGKTKIIQKIKPPKLMEAYKYYFGYEPAKEHLHNAIIDVVACLRIYFVSLIDGQDIYGTNPIIDDYIMRISPPGYSCGISVLA